MSEQEQRETFETWANSLDVAWTWAERQAAELAWQVASQSNAAAAHGEVIESRWILVSEKKPDNCVAVLCWWPSPSKAAPGEFGVAHRRAGRWESWESPYDDEDDYITPYAWMPLPAAPEQQTN